MPPNKLLETDVATLGRDRRGSLLASNVVGVAGLAAGHAAQQPIRYTAEPPIGMRVGTIAEATAEDVQR